MTILWQKSHQKIFTRVLNEKKLKEALNKTGGLSVLKKRKPKFEKKKKR